MSKVLTTPKGKAVYPRIDTPDTKYNVDGVYSCKLHVSEEEFDAFSQLVTKVVDAGYDSECRQKGKKLRKAPTAPLRITPDGDYEIYAKQVAQRETTKGLLEFTVPVFDSLGKKLPKSPSIGSGSTVRLSVEVYCWFTDLQGFGYTLRLKAVQLIDLIEYTNGGTTPSGFEVETGGYVQNESLDTAFTEEEESTPTESLAF